jgi:mono/diheme cytochrome c family protein
MTPIAPQPAPTFNQRAVAVGIFSIMMLGGLIATVVAQRPGASRADPVVLTEGRAIYATYCAGCHGANLEGQPNWQQRLANGMMPAPPHDATGHTWHHADDLLFLITKEGGAAAGPPGYSSGMPGFGGQLSDAEIWAVLAYIKSTWPAEIQAMQQDITQQSE